MKADKTGPKQHALIGVYADTHHRVKHLAESGEKTICVYMQGLIDREWKRYRKRLRARNAAARRKAMQCD